MKTTAARTAKMIPWILFSVLAAFKTSIHAAPVQSINVQTFNPSTSDHFVLLEDAFRSEWPLNAKYYFGLNYNYVTNPLVAVSSDTQLPAGTIVDSVQTIDLMFGFKASSRLGLFWGMPFHYVTEPGATILSIPAASSTALGDMKLLAKIRLTDDDSPLSFALIPEIHLPTGNTQYFVSDASTYFAIRAAVERVFNNFTLTGNIGYAAASNSMYVTSVGTIDFRQRLLLGLGGFMPFNDRLGMNLEFNLMNLIPPNSNLNPNELYGGIRYAFNQSCIGTLGASLGKIGGAGGENFRLVAGIRLTVNEDPAPLPSPTPNYLPLSSPTPMPVYTPTPLPRVVMMPKRIELSTPVNFKEDSSLLTRDGELLLDEVADVMSKNRNSYSKILIDGHTNTIGKAPHNLWLSLERAKSVKHYLVGKGISQNVLEARGFGQERPKVPYSNPNAMEINRRVEFNIVP